MDDVYKKILWLIPARSGSKSVPDKNINNLGGKPLMAYRILSALEISGEVNVWLSTDSELYGEIGSSYGAQIPFIRPAYLSTDTASSIAVVLHAIKFAEDNGFDYEYIGLLEPTSPFIYTETLKHALKLLHTDSHAEAIVAVRDTHPNSFFIQEDTPYLEELSSRLSSVSNTHRQVFANQITPSGGFYISKWEAIKQHKTFYTAKTIAYKVPKECGLEIDEPIDWLWAEFLLNNGVVLIK
jgi:CMP-N-acetylneuraminic acid synthetase